LEIYRRGAEDGEKIKLGQLAAGSWVVNLNKGKAARYACRPLS